MTNNNEISLKSINEIYGRNVNYGNLFEFTYAASLYNFFISALITHAAKISIDEIYNFMQKFSKENIENPDLILQNTEVSKVEFGTVYFQYKIRQIDINLIGEVGAENQIKKMIQSSLNSFRSDEILNNLSLAMATSAEAMLVEKMGRFNPKIEVYVKMDGLDTAINIKDNAVGQAKSDVSWIIKATGKEIAKNIISLKLGSKTLTNRSPYEILGDIASFAKINIEQQTKLSSIGKEIETLSHQYDLKKRSTEVLSQTIAKEIGKEYLFSAFEEYFYGQTQSKFKSNTTKPKLIEKSDYKSYVQKNPNTGIYLLTQADKVDAALSELTSLKETYVNKVLEYTNLLIQTISQVTDIKLKDFFEFVKLNLFGTDTDEVIIAKLPKTKDPVIKNFAKNTFGNELTTKLEYSIVPENNGKNKTIKFNAIIANKKMPLISIRLKNSQLYPLNVHARKLDFKTMVELPASSIIKEEDHLYDLIFAKKN